MRIFKVAALSLKPEIRLHAKWPSSERLSQSDERKNYSVPDRVFCQPGERVVLLQDSLTSQRL